MAATIVFVDSRAEAVGGVKRIAGKELRILHRRTLDEARALFAERGAKVTVVVVAMRVGAENGLEFLAELRREYPATARVLLADGDDACGVVPAVNEAHLYRYVTEPCEPPDLLRHVRDALAHHRRQQRERRAARNSLIGSVKALVDILDLVNPEAIGYSKRIRDRVLAVGRALGVRPMWKLELAVTLCNIGCVALPGEIVGKLNLGEDLGPEEEQIFSMHPDIAANLLRNIDQMAPVAEIIRHQLHPLSDGQPLESRIIKVAFDLDKQEHKGVETREALVAMLSDRAYDPRVVKAMVALVGRGDAPARTRKVTLANLRAGMVLAEDLVNREGTKLLLRGQKVSKVSLSRLQGFAEALGIEDDVVIRA